MYYYGDLKEKTERIVPMKASSTPWGFGPESESFDEVMLPHPSTKHARQISDFTADFRGRAPGSFEDQAPLQKDE